MKKWWCGEGGGGPVLVEPRNNDAVQDQQYTHTESRVRQHSELNIIDAVQYYP
jgi:hypothetical protein